MCLESAAGPAAARSLAPPFVSSRMNAAHFDTSPASRRKKLILLTLFLALPFFLVSGMLWYAFENPPITRPVINPRGLAEPADVQDSAQFVPAESLPQGVILIVEDRSGKASDDSPIYLASTMNAWNPADPAMKFTRGADTRWTLALPRPFDGKAVQFRFTRGTRESEEANDDGSLPPPRSLPSVDISKLKPGEPPRIELVVHAWAHAKK